MESCPAPRTKAGGLWPTVSPPPGITCRWRFRRDRTRSGSNWPTTRRAPSWISAALARPGSVAGPAAPAAPPALTANGRPPPRDLPAQPGRRWLAGDLHTHTVHSDGGLTVPELALLAARNGLDFLAITDHNTVSHHVELPGASAKYGITLLPGQEVTTNGGHAGALGDIGWVDFREPPDVWLAHTEC